MATMNATVDGWRNRQTATWFPSSGFSSIGSGTGASLYIASNPSGNNKYTICLRIKTPSSAAIGSISKLSVTFKMYKGNSTSGTLYGSLRTTYTDSGSGDTASTFRNNAIGSEASTTYGSTSYGTFTFEFSGSFSQGTYYYLFIYSKSNSDIYYTEANKISPSAVATYSVKTYAIQYNANGGSGAPSTHYKTHDVATTISTTKPTNECKGHTVEIDKQTLNVSFRNKKDICDLANQVFTQYSPCGYRDQPPTDHDGIFLSVRIKWHPI